MGGYDVLFRILNFLPGMIGAVFITRLTECLLRFRGKAGRAAVYAGYIFLFSNVIYRADPVNITAALAAYLLLLVCCTKNSMTARAAVVLLLYPIIVGTEFLLVNNPLFDLLLDIRLAGGFPVELQSPRRIDIIYNAYMIGGRLLKAFAWYGVYRAFRKKSGGIIGSWISDSVWRYVALVCTASFFSLMFGVIFPPASELAFYPVPVFAVAANIGVLFLLLPLVENMRRRLETETGRVREEYYRSVEEQQIRFRRLRHDLNNHFQILSSCLERHDEEAARQYLDELIGQFDRGEGRKFCENPILNALLNNRYARMEENGIDMSFQIHLGEIMGVTPLELCTLFSNALDNAVEGCLKIENKEKRYIRLKTRYREGYLSFEIKNSKANAIRSEGGRILSDKGETAGSMESAEHGCGLGNIREIVEKYGGKMEVSYTEEEFLLFFYLLC